MAKLVKASRDTYIQGGWLILYDLWKNWVAEGVASKVNNFTLYPLCVNGYGLVFFALILTQKYRHSMIYAVNVGTHKKDAESENCINRGYLVVHTKGRKIL